ncbi:HNH endonuclease [Blautia wexlerae]|nr:HNH endonuclease [Blautia wexlerae]
MPIGGGYYLVSSKGRVLSLCNNVPRELKPFINNGYHYITIEGKDERVNRLVAKAFIENPDDLPVVHHKDGCKLNNDISNLQWTTYSENTKEYYRQKKAKERAAEGQ